MMRHVTFTRSRSNAKLVDLQLTPLYLSMNWRRIQSPSIVHVGLVYSVKQNPLKYVRMVPKIRRESKTQDTLLLPNAENFDK